MVSQKTPVGTVEKLSEPGTGVLELKEVTPDAFLEMLGPDHKFEGLTFKLADSKFLYEKSESNEMIDPCFILVHAREVMRKAFQNKRGGKGGRGGGRGGSGRGGGRPQKRQRKD